MRWIGCARIGCVVVSSIYLALTLFTIKNVSNIYSFANESLSKLGYDVVTIDGSVDRATARATVGGRTGLQGNYDPRELIEDEEGTKTVDTVRATAKQLLEDLGPQRLVANLGEGLGGKESPELVRAFVDAVHEESEALIKSS